MTELFLKYNTPVPRYTSYPTVPAWYDTPTETEWKDLVKNSFDKTNSKNGISLYIHLPFCESLCTYCACNTRITVNHKFEKPYIEALLKEWNLYLKLFSEKPLLKEIHLGGGTPTFFSSENLEHLLKEIISTVKISSEHEFSFEGHPSNTSNQHLQALFNLGFKRVSFGIQDFDEKVQDAINRFQSFEEVERVVKEARKIGYTSINFDLVYGLPFQTDKGLKITIEKVKELQPDRIAFYSYAHVPWLKPGQRKFSEQDLPKDLIKRKLYDLGVEEFKKVGYVDIGMDHFALKTDKLYHAMIDKKLHRNFMGYTDKYTELLIGIGTSSISDTWNGFAQNIKSVEEYQQTVSQGLFPIVKGHKLTEEDNVVRKHILEIMCDGITHWRHDNQEFNWLKQAIDNCQELQGDQLLIVDEEKLVVTNLGKNYLRVICSQLDRYFQNNLKKENVFSSVA